jgi:hypothetical protein
MNTLHDLAKTLLEVAERADSTWNRGGPTTSQLVFKATADMWGPDGTLICILLSDHCWNDSIDWADRYTTVPFPHTPYTKWDMTNE